ncbi:SpoIIE family protein phosphatase [Sulfidibacter corallicola]|uniref:SpoIIE family protein phosphatase n=1 Tax=Sulfidibacter corallicola TaxID=2818388 RepID=A0A8A4TVG6_SULCO|nr:SpoIIE family protein phosphatase [Sulfidibacter corallicola]QTD53939.1 SpoIIE family protein phosphatase [Sulfidibacter corallicola]
MNILTNILKNQHWQNWVNPLLTVLFLYLSLHYFFSSEPLYELVSQDTRTQGQAPEVTYHALPRLYLLAVSGLLFNIFFFQSLRLWARYYLNRKLFLSYLVFAIIPILTTFLFFTEMIRTGFGLYSVQAVERNLNQFTLDLSGFVGQIQTELRNTQMNERELAEFINELRKKEMPHFSKSGDCLVDVYYLSPKIPKQPLTMATIYRESEDPFDEPFTREYTEAYEWVYPSWMRDQFTDIIFKKNQIYLYHISKETHGKAGSYLVIASLPTSKTFLNKLSEAQKARITLHSENGSISSDLSEGKWYIRLLLRLFSSSWDMQVLDWQTGYYRYFGEIKFDIQPSLILGTIERVGSLNIFHEEEKEHVLQIIAGAAVALFLCELIAIIFGIYLVSYITRSLNIIALGHEKVAQGQLSYRLPYLGKDQIGAMGRSFNSMVSNIESLLQQVMEQQKYKEELRIARDIQMSLLTDVASLKWVENIAATCIPAREVGGDYYEILNADGGEVGIFIADVSGKGTSAAFYMAELKGVLIALRHLWNDPKALLMRMNEILHAALQSNVFISGAYLLINPETQRGKLARAGHCPAFHVRNDGSIHELSPPGMAIGIAKNNVFGKIMKVAEFELEPDDKLILYTDGLDEMTFHNEMYGIGRLKSVLSENAHMEVFELKDKILNDVLGFLSSGEQNDDLTLVVSGLPKRIPQPARMRKELAS